MLVELKEFYCDVLGLNDGYRPNLSTAGFWLYSDEMPIIHLTEDEDRTVLEGKFNLDHVAFSSAGLDEFIKKLENRKIPYKISGVSELSITQVFLHDPIGIGIEVGFS